LRLASSGAELLDPRARRGGALAGAHSEGAALEPQPDGPTLVRHSPLGTRLTASAALGAAIHVRTTVKLYHQLPWIDLTWEFDFEDASVGTFFDDESKLRVQFALAFAGKIHHDIAFGVTTSLEDRPFFPASWVDVSDGEKGLAYFHQGT